MRWLRIIPLIGCVLSLTTIAGAAPVPDTPSASEILAATGVTGGLIVQVGCGDGKLTAALRVDDSYVVHGLDRDPDNVRVARQHVQQLGLYGSVFVEPWSSDRLPYIDNAVDLVVSEDLGKIQRSEVQRILSPGGKRT